MESFISSRLNLLNLHGRPTALFAVFLLILCVVPSSVRAQVQAAQQNTGENNSSSYGDLRPAPRVSDLAAEALEGAALIESAAKRAHVAEQRTGQSQ